MARGDDFFAKAEKKASSSTGWFSSSSTKWEEAADLFQQAGNAYKVDGAWAQSGKAFEKEAGCRLKADEKNDAMNAFHNAAKSLKKVDPAAAVNALHQTIKLVLDAGNFRQAADREKEIAQIYAQDGLDIAKARDSYQRAGDWYKQEDANATANQCYQSAAELSADLGDYQRAVQLYTTVADWSLTSPLTKYSVKEYWLRAIMCSIAMGDLVLAQRNLNEFAHKDLTFPSTREAKFAKELVDACEEADVDRFTAAVFQYDQVTKLDNWKTKILLHVKKALEEDEGGLT
ncbi:hypothetical protein CcaverHIS002_0408680 [Cutaneotrichosporon cavernicola]|uniref:Vesicular-fusion protein SEC17 n=1 Tax=Cutaneotrichosporon cavernicola TaxID=279322 RepID=A0AA48QWD1_9TREE|nr:uncharacterized protein CcaverHIS019_0408620 [Cutaneotrichosporon cavernicola]BEI84264.1 hypothetical protein CcaverHIS002_0408680 [Cutaneotrichosporon cavernicola]BEI92042.1 hypothetical protein CcaverHIS019_0408620 [Cutaneotrichosporon cavernicola]BEI99812.1 hypothetical protein CcaverHIS631_0408550 [Cutaneotrichosporon cavernicola]BEJ07588.1 hypothetical protein CcaverHIS641_0408570 [Cutaneotrichosporon cavernicola]